jgi:hypothetical protein
MEDIFTDIYEKNIWGYDGKKSYNGSSGGGSEIAYNESVYIPFLKKFINENNIKNVVDLGCGNFKCGPLIYNDLNIVYTGYDTYNKIITYNSQTHKTPKYTFIHLDFYSNKDKIINGDVCILKDVLQHWRMDEIYTFLDYLVENKKFKYIILCNCYNQTIDNPKNSERSTPLSSNYLPLKKYNIKKLFTYNTKEVSLIEIVLP